MSIEFYYENGIIYGAFKSPLSIGEVKKTFAVLTNSTQFPADANTLWDLRELDFTQVDHDMEKQLITMREQHPERGEARIAFVVSNDLGFGMMRRYEMLSTNLPQQICVFKDFGEAEAWLQVIL